MVQITDFLIDNGIVTPEAAKNLSLAQIKEIMNARFFNLPGQLKLYMGEDSSKERIITFLEDKADELYYFSDYLDDVGEEYLNKQMMFNMVEFELYFDMLNHRFPLKQYDMIGEFGKKAAGFLKLAEECYEYMFNSMMDVVDRSINQEKMQMVEFLTDNLMDVLNLVYKDMKSLNKILTFEFYDSYPKFSFVFDNDTVESNYKDVESILKAYCMYGFAVGGNLVCLLETDEAGYVFSLELSKRDFRCTPVSELVLETEKNYSFTTLDELLNDENFFLSRSV